MNELCVIEIPWTDGSEYVALSRTDYYTVLRDRAAIDDVEPKACLQVKHDGTESWQTSTLEGRAAIEQYRQR